MSITHDKVSLQGAPADPEQVGGEDWNADHLLTGDIPVANLPVGTGSSEVAAGDHAHAAYASLPGDAANGELAIYSGGVPTNMALTSAGASFSSTNQWQAASNAFDSNDSTYYWANSAPPSAGNLIVDMGTSRTISRIRILQNTSGGSILVATGPSTSGSWTQVAELPITGGDMTVNFTAATSRYWRLTTTGGGASEWTVHDCKMFEVTTVTLDNIPATTYQPLDSDLTAIAALTTATTGRSLLAAADAAAIRTIADASQSTHTHASSYDGSTVDDIVVESWVDLSGTNGSSGLPFYYMTRSASNGPTSNPSLMTTTSNTPMFLMVRYLTPGVVLKVDMWVKTESGGQSFIKWRTNGVDTNINNDGVSSWARKIFYVTVGADGLFGLIGVYNVSMANLIITQVGNRHLFDSWVDRADTNTNNGQAMTGCSRNATGGPDGGPSLTLPSGAGPSTLTTWTGLRVGATYELAFTHKSTSGGVARVYAVVSSGTYTIADDDMGNQWDQVRYRVVVGASGSLALTSTYTNEIADFRLYDLGIGYQPLDADLTSIAALTTTSTGRSVLTVADSTALAATHSHGGSVPAATNAAALVYASQTFR